MAVYAIAQSRVTNPDQFQHYLAAAGPTLDAHGVKLLALDEAATIIEGESSYPRLVILEFDSTEHFHRWYDSPEYTAARQHRLDAAVGTFMLVQGF